LRFAAKRLKIETKYVKMKVYNFNYNCYGEKSDISQVFEMDDIFT